MRRLALLLLVVVLAACGGGGEKGGSEKPHLNGAGSSFVFPLVDKWRSVYDKARVDYNPIGSGGGIEAIVNRTVDFGTSDAPLSEEQAQACNGCVVIPWALSATSVAYNLEGAPEHLKITGPVLADIYLGKVKRWNDPALTKLNPGASLPDSPVTPIFRSDSSGTTYNFTEYLSSVSPEFKQTIGNSTQVNFPVGVGGSKSAGVAAVLQRSNGGITYVDVAYALESKFQYFAVQNAAGKFVVPTLDSIAAAGKVAKPGSLSVVNPKGAPDAYPVCTYSYVIVPKSSPKAQPLKEFISWALRDGQQYGPPLLFAPLPAPIADDAKRKLDEVGS
jgi:phosphate transport system substrate-binding protein